MEFYCDIKYKYEKRFLSACWRYDKKTAVLEVHSEVQM